MQEIEPGKTQLLHVKHKVLAASCIRRDLAVLRTWKEEGNGGYLVVLTSIQSTKVPKSNDFVRGELVFAGYLIENVRSMTLRTPCTCHRLVPL